MSRRVRGFLSALAVVVLFCLPLLPEILGTRRLVFRDAQITHWPWRRVATESLRSGHVPFVNDRASGGQPLLANPNAALLYPTLLLETVLPAASAFNLHYLLHVLWAFFGAYALARRLGLSEGASFFSAVTFAFSGIVLSYASAFANSAAAASWLPWCAAAGLDLVRAEGRKTKLRAAASTGIAFGLQLLAGEPALSLLTILFLAFLALPELWSAGHRRGGRARTLLAAAASGTLATALASPLLAPLAAVLPLTYRGQHLYSERAFGASPFTSWRMIEWLFPRFNGDPGALGEGAHWQYALHRGDLVYIWCVTFGVIPLLAVLLASLERPFWTRRTAWLAGGALFFLLFSFGSSLPLYRLLFSLAPLRRLRYPIKFYLLTTLVVALLAGFAVERLRERSHWRRRIVGLFAAFALFSAAFLLAGEGGALEQRIRPLLSGLALPPEALLPAIRQCFRGDALLGMAAVLALAVLLLPRRPTRGLATYGLGLATLLLAFPWGLPLFVSADERDLARPPALRATLRGPGRLYVSPRLPEFNVLSTGSAHPELAPLVSKLARLQIEELIPATGAPFGIRYLFDSDPDGSYGYFNRLAGEVLAASSPAERSRLLRAFGARWILGDEGEDHPFFHPTTGFEIAGRRLMVFELSDPLPPLRWASREYRRVYLSSALELVRSQAFRPTTDVSLPGRSDRDPANAPVPAKLSADRVEAGRASAYVEATCAGHLVFSRTYFSAWKARLDGRTVPVLVANGRDLAVAVPSGSHRVEFEYDQQAFRWGVAVQAAALLLILAALVASR